MLNDGRDGFQPRHVLEERLVLSGDARDGLRVWAVRRPKDDAQGYAVELWASRDGRPPGRIELPFSLAAPPRIGVDGALVLVGAEEGPPGLWRVAADGRSLEQLVRDQHVLDAEPSPVDGRIVFRALADEPRFLVGKDVARRIDAVDFLADGVGFRDRRTHAHVWDAGSAAPILQGDRDVHACGWAAGGGVLWLLVGMVRDRPWEEHELWTADGEALDAPRIAVADPGWVVDVALSPDASQLAWSARGDFADETRLWVLDRRSDTRRRVDGGVCVDQASFPDLLPLAAFRTQLDFEDDAALLALGTARGRPGLYRFSLDGSDPERLAEDVVPGFLRRAAGSTLLVGSTGRRPAELLEVEGTQARPLSAHGAWFPAGAWPDVGELVARNGTAEVHGWVMTPPGGGRADAPLVLHVHGGPYSAHGPVPWLEMAALTARGCTVLCPNPRGSVSYGEAWSRAIAGRWGTDDAADLHAFVDAAIEEGLGSAERLGLMGLSYGGYMTVHLLGTSDRFRAAIAENPVTNFVSEFGMSDLGALGAQLFGGSDEIDVEAWLRASPLVNVHRITTPLLLLHGERDDRCPLPESMQTYTILKALGREVELVRLPEESHMMFALARPDRRVYRLECIVEWFERHLR